MKKGTGWDNPKGVKMPFQLKKLDMGVGGSHPAVARLVLGPADSMQMTNLTPELRDLIGRYLFRCMQEFVKIEKKREAFLAKCAAFHASVKEGKGVIAQSHAIELHEPEGLEDDYELFLLHLVLALRMAASAAGLILYGEPMKWPGLKKRLKAEQPNSAVLRTMEAHEPWTSDLFDVRGEIEHDPYLFRGFTVQQDGLTYKVVDPQLTDGTSAVQAFPKFYADGFACAEDLVIGAITTRLPDFVRLREIPEDQLDPSMPKRFALEIRPGSHGER